MLSVTVLHPDFNSMVGLIKDDKINSIAFNPVQFLYHGAFETGSHKVLFVFPAFALNIFYS